MEDRPFAGDVKPATLWSEPKRAGPGWERESHMPKIKNDALLQVQGALDRYEKEVEATNCTPKTKETYILHAQHFVRWLDDDFEPGAKLRSRVQPH